MIYFSLFLFLFVCLRSATVFFPRGQLPREAYGDHPYHPGHSSPPGPCLTFCSLSPRTFAMHPASGLYPPMSSCPVHTCITYRVSGLSLPCFPVLHIYSNPSYQLFIKAVDWWIQTMPWDVGGKHITSSPLSYSILSWQSPFD